MLHEHKYVFYKSGFIGTVIGIVVIRIFGTSRVALELNILTINLKSRTFQQTNMKTYE